MRIGGVAITPPVEEVLVLPRGDAQLVFRAIAVKSWDEFEKLCPSPEPPKMLVKNKQVPDAEDPGYKSLLNTWYLKRLSYLIIKSLEPSNIEWDTVDIYNPSTWLKVEEEFIAAGITDAEFQKIVQTVLDANSLNEDKLKAAREAFLHGQVRE